MAFNLPQEDFRHKINLATFALLFFGIFLFSIGLGLLFFKKEAKEDIKIISSSESKAEESEIMVHVEGAVVRPGLYKLGSGARVNDAIEAAGGLDRDADQAKINLAAKVADGQKIHVYSAREAGTVSGVSQTGLVDINTASEAQLDKLPGVGPVTAQKIISSRPYSTLEELVSKKAVSSAVFEKIKDKITIY